MAGKNTPAASDDEDRIPLPEFDQTYIDRGFYLVSQFQDEKRRRDRDAALSYSRRCPDYVCLMTADNRLIHRNTFKRTDIVQFMELYQLIQTWATPEFFVMGYPIEASDLMQGLECYAQMGKTCNRLIQNGEQTTPSYVGCPRASISFKYMHPKSWYALYRKSLSEPKRYRKVDAAEPPSEDFDAQSWERSWNMGAGELRNVSRKFCGCPLVHLKRTETFYYDNLPDVIVADGEEWRIAPDMMGEPSLQPKSKTAYFEFLDGLPVHMFPSSERPEPIIPIDTDEDEEAPAARPERDLSKYSWLLDD